MSAAKPGWAIEPIADPLGAGPFVRPIALKFNGWTVKTFHSQADAELWLSVNYGPRCRNRAASGAARRRRGMKPT